MAIEIERKFLLREDDFSWKQEAIKKIEVLQGHFLTTSETAIRVRICDDREAVLTIKGRGGEGGCSRPEYEYPVPVEDARRMMELFCQDRIISKTRYVVPAAEPGLRWEIDEYHGSLDGHFNAELEIPDEEFCFVHPKWLGQEVTGRPEYTNAALALAQRWPSKSQASGDSGQTLE